MADKWFKYYIVYSYVLPNGGGLGLRMGSTDYEANGPMEDGTIRRAAAEHIADLGFVCVVIISWKRID